MSVHENSAAYEILQIAELDISTFLWDFGPTAGSINKLGAKKSFR